ncbi:MAG: DUF5034 domain-containing protein [Niabella sp.]
MKHVIFKTILLACLVTGLPGLFFACKKDSDNGTPIGGGGGTYLYFKLKSLTVKNGDKSVASGEAKTSVKKEDYFIGIVNERETTSKPQASISIPFINAAYAALGPIFVNVDTIKSVKIITLKDFDQTLPAGSDVTGKFGVGDRILQDWQILHALSYYVPIYQTPFAPVSLKLFPEKEIKAAQFKVVYTLDSGRQLEATTPEIDLL